MFCDLFGPMNCATQSAYRTRFKQQKRLRQRIRKTPTKLKRIYNAFNDKYLNDKNHQKTNDKIMKTFQRIYFREPRFLLVNFSCTHFSFHLIGIFEFFFFFLKQNRKTDRKKIVRDACAIIIMGNINNIRFV